MDNLLSICRSIQANMARCPDLRYLETQQGMKEVWTKLPESFISRWRKEVTTSERNSGYTPSFSKLIECFSEFIEEFSNPIFCYFTRKAPSL